MSAHRADLGTPSYVTCPVCLYGYAVHHPILILTEDGVHLEPWALTLCRDCGRLIKTQLLLPTQEERP